MSYTNEIGLAIAPVGNLLEVIMIPLALSVEIDPATAKRGKGGEIKACRAAVRVEYPPHRLARVMPLDELHGDPLFLDSINRLLSNYGVRGQVAWGNADQQEEGTLRFDVPAKSVEGMFPEAFGQQAAPDTDLLRFRIRTERVERASLRLVA